MKRSFVLTVVGLLALLGLVPAAHAISIADAQGYLYPVMVDDPAGDNAGPFDLPGDAFPEVDLLGFDMTDDGDFVVMRYELGAMSWDIPGTVTVTTEMTGPGGEDWEATIVLESGGTVSDVSDFDPTSGDPDTLIPGASAAVDTAANMVYLFIDMNEAGMALGDTLTIDAINTGRGVAAPGVLSITFPDRDSIPPPAPYTLQRGAFPSEPEAPAIQYFDVENDTLTTSFDEATNVTYRYNWTTSWTNVNVTYSAVVENGSVQFLVRDASNTTMLDKTVTGDFTETLGAENATAGTWQIIVQFTGFQGSFDMQMSERILPQTGSGNGGDAGSGDGSDGGSGGNGSDGSSGGDGSDGSDGGMGGDGSDGSGTNSTTGQSNDSPGLGTAFVLLGLVGVALLVRRRF